MNEDNIAFLSNYSGNSMELALIASSDLEQFVKGLGLPPTGAKGFNDYSAVPNLDLFQPLTVGGGTSSPTAVLPPVLAMPMPYRESPFASSEGSGPLMSEEPNDHDSSPITQTKAAKGRGKKSAQDQKERIRAKNRRAQARYREKQKSVRQQTKTDLDQITSEVARLRVENEHLNAKKTVMEKVLTVRDLTASILESGIDAKSATPLLPPFAQQVGALNPAKCYKNTCPLTGLSSSDIRALQGQPAEAVARKYKGFVDRIKENLPESCVCCSEFPSCECHTAAAFFSNNGAQVLSAEEEDAALPETPAVIRDILFEMGVYCFENGVHNPTAMQKIMAAHLDDDNQSKDRWPAIVHAMKYTSAQKAACREPLQKFEARVAALTAARRSLLTQLTSLTVPAGAISFQSNTEHALSITQITSELNINIQEEHVACMELLAGAFGRVLTPLQKAIAISAAYPAFPDAYTMAKVALQQDRMLLLNESIGGKEEESREGGDGNGLSGEVTSTAMAL